MHTQQDVKIYKQTVIQI